MELVVVLPLFPYAPLRGKSIRANINPTVGGLVGSNEGTITRCRTDVEITVDRVNLGGVHFTAGAGGIVGINEYSGLLFACHAIGSITMEVNTSEGNSICAGGIAGWNSNKSSPTIYCCIAEGNVSVTSETAYIDIYAGGLVGYHNYNGVLKVATPAAPLQPAL